MPRNRTILGAVAAGFDVVFAAVALLHVTSATAAAPPVSTSRGAMPIGRQC
jgi:hypothetical protein